MNSIWKWAEHKRLQKKWILLVHRLAGAKTTKSKKRLGKKIGRVEIQLYKIENR